MAHGDGIGIAAALSGGGSKGAFQVGVLAELEDIGVRVDAFAGVSTGAIQAMAGAMEAVPQLVADWSSIRRNRDIHFRRLLPIVSKYNSDALLERIRRFANANGPVKRPLRVGVVSLQSGEFRLIDGLGMEPDQLARWVYASCMVPVEYAPVERERYVRDTTQWVDGGARTVTPLAVAAAFEPRGVLMIRAHPTPTVAYDGRRFGTILDIGKRAIDVLQSEVSLNDMAGLELGNAFHAMRERIESGLASCGAPPDVAEMMRCELDRLADDFGLVRVFPIRPEHEYSATNNYHPIDIAAAIEAGRRTVDAQRAAILDFVRTCGRTVDRPTPREKAA
ncbi:patatin-like phospholipase family protein [Sphingomonas lenta]|uniref:PNPLA domain-containing protein n=1 Tax=Sphingomonas lenta TaxID=1141887 RepID=A0A2A2SBG3_9SPHN|nr:patatin-like phospholipase family protein [Sphingomonas lenta]PAX06535.1 hypothetical protein CKY28_15380 [Sphingomonas lenta]